MGQSFLLRRPPLFLLLERVAGVMTLDLLFAAHAVLMSPPPAPVALQTTIAEISPPPRS